jgi:hypothetical protein
MRCMRRKQSDVVYCQLITDQMAEGHGIRWSVGPVSVGPLPHSQACAVVDT